MRREDTMIRRFVLMVTAVFMMLVLAGCGGSDNDEIALAVVCGTTSNEPDVSVISNSIKDTIYNTCYSYGSVAFISCDGSPKVVYQTTIPRPDKSGLSENKKKTIATGYTNQLLKEKARVRSVTPEVDTLEAVNCAAKVLSGSGMSADKILIVQNSGLSTAGYLDFTQGLLYADIEDIVTALKGAKAIPDLTGVHVICMYTAQTALPQEQLSEAQKQKLEDIWYAIYAEAGAASIEFTSDMSSDLPDSDLPYVSVVDVEERSIEVSVEDVIRPVSITIEQPIETIILDNTQVRFVGDKAVFVDKDEASRVLEQYADLLLDHPDNEVYIIGTTATGDRGFCEKLSIARAEAVKEVLCSFGVAGSQMKTVGLGYEDPWHIDDLDSNGSQIEEYACKNRKVLIVDINSEDAELLR